MSGPTSVEQLCNLALDRIGFPEYIGNIDEGTKQARACLNNYAETRDALLRSKDWPFALKQASGASAGSPPVGWLYSWTYPTDCLRVRSVLPSTVPSPNYDPQPTLSTLYNNGTIKLILTQFTPITINYVGQIVDVTTWEPLFVELMVQTLAARIGAALRRADIAPSLDPAEAMAMVTGSSDAQAPDDVMPMVQREARR
jgi:hypothetical protein